MLIFEVAMKVIAFVGPYGAGKTSLMRQSLRLSGIDPSLVGVILNEAAGDHGQTDADDLRTFAWFSPLVNGCITCQNPAEARGALKKMWDEGVQIVLMEGFGIVSGHETRGFLLARRTRECLDVPSLAFGIFCVFDCENFKINRIKNMGVLASQVGVADLGIGLTKYPEGATSLQDPRLADVRAYLDEHMIPGTEIRFLARGSGIDLREILPHLRSMHTHHDRDCAHCRDLVYDSHGHVHNHAHPDEHDGHDDHHLHDLQRSYRLKQGTMSEDVRRAFKCAAAKKVFRFKFATQGWLFSGVNDKINQMVPHSGSFVTYYSDREIDLATDFPELSRLIDDEIIVGRQRSYELLRDASISCDENVALIKGLLAGMPRGTMVIEQDGMLRVQTHPEHPLQEVKEIARRPNVIDEWFPVVLKRCMEYWIETVRFIRENSERIRRDDLAYNRRELAKSLAWWTNRFGNFFGEEIVAAVNDLHVGIMAAEGMYGLTSLNDDDDDPERAKWECIELCEAIQFGLVHGEDREVLLKAVEHCVVLSKSCPAVLYDQWHAALELLQV